MIHAAELYNEDLTLLHHEGHGDYPKNMGKILCSLLAEAGITPGSRVLDVGCGTGIVAGVLTIAGYSVHGIDASTAMINVARDKCQDASFAVDDASTVDAAGFAAIVSTGHVFNYLASEATMKVVLLRLYEQLPAGGVLMFDLLVDGGRHDGAIAAMCEAHWAMFTRFSKPRPNRYVRHITTFREIDGGAWRRHDIDHTNIVIDVAQVQSWLEEVGAAVTVHKNGDVPGVLAVVPIVVAVKS